MKIRNWTDHSYRVHRWTVQSRGGCEIRNVPTAVDRTVSSTKILGLFVTKVPFNIWRD